MIICAGANVRHNAFLRGNVIIGEKAVVGNSCELKNALLFDEVQVPHFNYVAIPSWATRHIWAQAQ